MGDRSKREENAALRLQQKAAQREQEELLLKAAAEPARETPRRKRRRGRATSTDALSLSIARRLSGEDPPEDPLAAPPAAGARSEHLIQLMERYDRSRPRRSHAEPPGGDPDPDDPQEKT